MEQFGFYNAVKCPKNAAGIAKSVGSENQDHSGPGCSKLTTWLVSETLKLQTYTKTLPFFAKIFLRNFCSSSDIF